MKSIVFALSMTILSCVFCSGTNTTCRRFVGGHYWRDYGGDIPSDALHGGLDKKGRIIYIGQALHEGPPNGKIIPGGIYPMHQQMIYVLDHIPYYVTHNVKILCSSYPEDYEWIPANISYLQSLKLKTLVQGGYDMTYNLNIGRIHAEGELLLGKVTLRRPYDAFGYVVDGQDYYVKTGFEVLSYKVRPHQYEEVHCSYKIVNVTVSCKAY